MREVSRAERDAHADRRAHAELALDGDRPAVQLDQLVDQRQSDPGALVRAPLDAAHSMEPVEQPGQLVLGDADAGVRDGQLGRRVDASQRHGDLAVEGELDRVREQVQDDLLPRVPIDVHRVVECRAVDAQAKPRALHDRSEHARDVAGLTREVGWRVGRFDTAGVDLREVDQRVDQPGEPPRVARGDLDELSRAGLRRRSRAPRSVTPG